MSVPQASKDLSLYQEHAPENIEYDRSLKRYFASDRFEPAFISLDADAYLGHLCATSPIGNDLSYGPEQRESLRSKSLFRSDALRRMYSGRS